MILLQFFVYSIQDSVPLKGAQQHLYVESLSLDKAFELGLIAFKQTWLGKLYFTCILLIGFPGIRSTQMRRSS